MKDWKDTTMTPEQRRDCFEKAQDIWNDEGKTEAWQFNALWEYIAYGVAQAQAEISWKAGIKEAQNRLHSPEVLTIAEEALNGERKAGRREVAEWIDAWWERGKCGKQNWYELEAKLKEWGLPTGV